MVALDELWPKLEQAGEDKVRLQLAKGVYGEGKVAIVREWLARKERERQDAAAAGQQAREDATLKLAAESNTIARDANALSGAANAISKRSNLIAWFALVMSLLALLLSAFQAWSCE